MARFDDPEHTRHLTKLRLYLVKVPTLKRHSGRWQSIAELCVQAEMMTGERKRREVTRSRWHWTKANNAPYSLNKEASQIWCNTDFQLVENHHVLQIGTLCPDFIPPYYPLNWLSGTDPCSPEPRPSACGSSWSRSPAAATMNTVYPGLLHTCFHAPQVDFNNLHTVAPLPSLKGAINSPPKGCHPGSFRPSATMGR
jgi:hypothetical protein